MTPGIVLAAGASTRMGRPKALLPVGDRSFLRRILDTFQAAGLKEAVVVVGPTQREVIAEIEAGGFGRVVVNPQPERGQLSSLIAGLDALDRPGIVSVLVTLVDVPLVNASTVATLLDRAGSSAAPILRAVHRNRHGHPVVFKCETFDALRHADPSIGAKAVLRAYAVEDVEIDDPGVVEDVDTPEDYARLLTAGAVNTSDPNP
jgi:molybdenum cofactor cytidylyltransferase